MAGPISQVNSASMWVIAAIAVLPDAWDMEDTFGGSHLIVVVRSAPSGRPRRSA
ncbi:hypothetical protein JCM17823_29160 [Halorubrum gandharaense]